jgi:RNA polymerase sigma factor (sigma-70 family)
MQPDAVLCKLCERGSDDAFAVLHARYSQQVFAFVFHLLNRPGSVDDAEDLTQEILGKAFSSMSSRREEGSFKAWLFRIARNHTFDHIRARKPRPVSLDDPDNGVEPSNVISLQYEVERRSEMNWLLAAMGRLPDRQREALVLRELGGMSYDEIGASLDTTPEGVKQLIKRGRATVSSAAESSGYRSKNLGRDLAMATPIATIGWFGVGAGKAGAAVAATGGAVASGGAAAGGATAGGAAAGGAAAGGAGLALVGGKVAATVLTVVAIGAGGVAVGEKVATDRSTDSAAAESVSNKSTSTPTTPAQSLTVGANAAERAKANKLAANARRERAKERRAKARAHHKAAAERAVAGKAHGKSQSPGSHGKGATKSAGHGKSTSGGGSSNGNSNAGGGGSGNGAGGNAGGNNSSKGTSGSDQSAAQGGGNGSGGSKGGGKPTD